MKEYSLVSIFITIVVLTYKTILEVISFKSLKEIFEQNRGDLSPTIVSSELFFLLPIILISFMLSIKGYRRKNKFKVLALALSLTVIVYLWIPIGAILAHIF